MANWLDITNTFINIETMRRVGDLSEAQQRFANQMLAVELQKERDNALLSQLVDIVVKVTQFVQNKQCFDALLSAGVGALAFKQLYPQIVDADTKLKASEIQVKLLDTIRSTVTDTSLRASIQASLTDYLSTVKDLLQAFLAESHLASHRLVWLDPSKEWQVSVGEELTPVQDVTNLATKSVMFRRGTLYKVVEVDNSISKGFYLINDFGQKWHHSFRKKGGADLFAFVDPPIPNFDQEVGGWELCDKLFSSEFLTESLKPVRSDVLAIYQRALEQSYLTKDKLIAMVSQYRQFRLTTVQQALQSPEIKALTKSEEPSVGAFKAFLSVLGGIIGTLGVLAIFLIISFLARNC
ncbi:MAG: hypothetical protein HBSIN02_25490 [Bacteroidia bacterium]|nr:MAG: hypothetical protein HBSIN02_25490 [Bacteroidia bacterium]